MNTARITVLPLLPFMLLFMLMQVGCKTEREIMQDQVELLVKVSEDSEEDRLLLNYLGSPKEDLDAMEGLLVVPSDLASKALGEDGIRTDSEFVLLVSRKPEDIGHNPVLQIFDPSTDKYTGTTYVIIGIKPKESIE